MRSEPGEAIPIVASTPSLGLRTDGPHKKGTEIRADGGAEDDLREPIVIGERDGRLGHPQGLLAEASRHDLGHEGLSEFPPALLIALAPGLVHLLFDDLQ